MRKEDGRDIGRLLKERSHIDLGIHRISGGLFGCVGAVGIATAFVCGYSLLLGFLGGCPVLGTPGQSPKRI